MKGEEDPGKWCRMEGQYGLRFLPMSKKWSIIDRISCRKRRLFVLTPSRLIYYKPDPAQPTEIPAKPKGVIELVEFVKVVPVSEGEGMGVFPMMLDTAHRLWEFRTDTKAEQERWISAMRSVGEFLKVKALYCGVAEVDFL